MKEYIRDLKAILDALDTLSLNGYKNCQTYSNCMLALSKVINAMLKDENDKAVENTETKEFVKDVVVDEE